MPWLPRRCVRRPPCPASARSPRVGRGVAIVLLLLGLGRNMAFAQYAFDDSIRFDRASDFGGVGLLQNPTARMAEDGMASIFVSHVWPYTRYGATMQILPWMEATLRYTNVSNRLYGPADFSGNQSLKDKGADVKIRLVEEGEHFPQIAVGFRDLGGTGLFAGEYIIANRRYYDLDLSLGMGWGYLGTRGQFRNPFRIISSRFDERSGNTVSTGGTIGSDYFSGERASLLAGINYRTPFPGVSVQAELDGNDYQSEPQFNNQEVRTPINFGVTYSPNPNIDLSVGLERGNEAMFRIVFKENLKTVRGFPKADPPPEAVRPRVPVAAPERPAASRPNAADGDADAAEKAIAESLESSGFRVESVHVDVPNQSASTKLSSRSYRSQARAAGRAARIIANRLPEPIEEIRVGQIDKGLETSDIAFLRKDIERGANGDSSAEELWRSTRLIVPGSEPATDEALKRRSYPKFSWSWSPAMRQQIGGPDSAFLYQIWLRAEGELEVARGWSLASEVGLDVHNNFDKLTLESDSKLPHVRSDIKEYLKQGTTNIIRLQADHVRQLEPNWYARATVGLFEEMFGGVGGEVLYRPYGGRWAMGTEIYRVRQRDYDQRFDFLDYEVTTGHVDYYYELPWYDLRSKISIGKYLAGDKGATLDLSRAFRNGVRIGAFATKTNVSAEQFGEGSFDKGVYISVPLDLVSTFSTRGDIGVVWRPLTRDGGQRLNISKRLYPLTEPGQPKSILNDWGSVLQ